MGVRMWVFEAGSKRWWFQCAPMAIALLGACSSGPEPTVQLSADAGPDQGDGGTDAGPNTDCDNVTIVGDQVTVHEETVTARLTMGELKTNTVMMFGGDTVDFDDAVSNVALKALDQTDAVMLAQTYPDFYLCSSPGGLAAQNYIVQFDLVPASCQVYDQLVSALADLKRAAASGTDRVSLKFDGAPLTLDSVTFDASGLDATDQLQDLNFYLVTKVEQITGESLLDFGMMQ